MKQQIAAANWKMNLTLEQAETLTDSLLDAFTSLQPNQQVILGVPFPYLTSIQQKTNGIPGVFIAAQNCYQQLSGAYTGEVSVTMLKSIGITHVIIGHSERREYFHETDTVLAEKVNLCLANGIKPIFCCGESLAIREAGNENNFVGQQIQDGLFHLSAEQITGFIIAYEPIWAIGTGKTASSEQAQAIQAHIRGVLADQYGVEVANSISILYGGSVKAANAKEIFGQPDVDGGLVGGASLVTAEFAAIIQSLK